MNFLHCKSTYFFDILTKKAESNLYNFIKKLKKSHKIIFVESKDNHYLCATF